jgi:hypothetical protein
MCSSFLIVRLTRSSLRSTLTADAQPDVDCFISSWRTPHLASVFGLDVRFDEWFGAGLISMPLNS